MKNGLNKRHERNQKGDTSAHHAHKGGLQQDAAGLRPHEVDLVARCRQPDRYTCNCMRGLGCHWVVPSSTQGTHGHATCPTSQHTESRCSSNAMAQQHGANSPRGWVERGCGHWPLRLLGSHPSLFNRAGPPAGEPVPAGRRSGVLGSPALFLTRAPWSAVDAVGR